MHEPGDVAPRAGETGDETAPDWIADLHEHDRYRARFPSQSRDPRVADHDDHVRGRSHQFARVSLPPLDVAARTKLDSNVAAIAPTELLESLPHRLDPSERLHILGAARQHCDPPQPLRLLRSCRERPCCRHTAEKRYELAPLHSITSSARASSVGGTSMPSALAVLRLTTSSNLVGCMTGRSVGLSPLRMRPV